MNPPRVYTCYPSWTPLLPRTIPLGRLSAPAPSILYHASNLDWRFVSYMIIYMFQCHCPKPSHPLPLPQSPKDCSIHLCLFCCLAYRVIITIWPSLSLPHVHYPTSTTWIKQTHLCFEIVLTLHCLISALFLTILCISSIEFKVEFWNNPF